MMAMTIGVGGVLPRAARAPRASTLEARAPVCAQAAKRKGFGKKPAKVIGRALAWLSPRDRSRVRVRSDRQCCTSACAARADSDARHAVGRLCVHAHAHAHARIPTVFAHPLQPAKKSAPAEPAYDPKNPLGLTTVEQVPRVGAQQPAGDAQEAEREVRGGRASLLGTLRARIACLVLRAWPLTRICVLARAGTC